MRARVLWLYLLAVVVPGLAAQSNGVSGLNARLLTVDGLQSNGRLGTYPNGRNGLSAGIDVCNAGTVPIDWFAPMNARHPFYGFIICREVNGRFEQISDRSYLKHGFYALNDNLCAPCTFSGSTRLGPKCSDTYDASLNADRYFLGPPREVDPWLAAWNPVGSHFDRGEPEVNPPQNTDGNRSLTQTMVNAMDPVRHRLEVNDADLAVANARYYYGAHVVVVGELDAVRDDDLISRRTTPTWSGSRWNFADQSTPVHGTILQHWAGATIGSASNGGDDGRFYVAVVVTGPDARGRWHYEYAVHNRDNSRAAAALRIPTCTSARVFNAAAHDIDADPSNDWGDVFGGGELTFVAGANNPLEWNTIYNFSFDSDAAPVAGQVFLDQARPGAGAASVAVNTQVPGTVFNRYAGDGCGPPAQSMHPAGSPPIARIPNPTFALRMEDLQPGSPAAVFLAPTPGMFDLGNGCNLLVGAQIQVLGPVTADAGGVATVLLPIPNEVMFEGASVWLQGIEASAGGQLLGLGHLTNALQVRIGNNISGCP